MNHMVKKFCKDLLLYGACIEFFNSFFSDFQWSLYFYIGFFSIVDVWYTFLKFCIEIFENLGTLYLIWFDNISLYIFLYFFRILHVLYTPWYYEIIFIWNLSSGWCMGKMSTTEGAYCKKSDDEGLC